MKPTMSRSRFLALVAVFASLNIVFDSIAGIPQFSDGVWYSWVFMTEPVTGLVLPPSAAFLSTLIGVMAGHSIYPRGSYEFIFMIGAPVGSLISALLSRGRRRFVLVYFAALLSAYFATPISWQLPLWGMWDTYLAFAGLLIAHFAFFKNRNAKAFPLDLAFYAFIGLEADILFRISIFIPCQTYRLLAYTAEDLQFIWIAGAIMTPIQVAVSVIFTSTIGAPLMKIIEKTGLTE